METSLDRDEFGNTDAIDDINTRIANSNKTSTNYSHHLHNFKKYLREHDLGTMEDISESTPQNIMLYMRHLNQKLKHKEREGVGSIKAFLNSVKYYYSLVHPNATKNIWDDVQLTGNPARYYKIEALRKSYENQVKFVVPKRSQAMTLKDLGALVAYIEQTSPLSELDKLKYSAIFVLAHYCWLRIDEVISLQINDLEENVESNRLTLRIRSRKTDQEANGTYYNLYDDTSEPELLVGTRLRRWISFYKRTVLRDTTFQPDSVLEHAMHAQQERWPMFPKTSNNAIQISIPCPVSDIQNELKRAVDYCKKKVRAIYLRALSLHMKMPNSLSTAFGEVGPSIAFFTPRGRGL
jgi:hypothetical protein